MVGLSAEVVHVGEQEIFDSVLKFVELKERQDGLQVQRMTARSEHGQLSVGRQRTLEARSYHYLVGLKSLLKLKSTNADGDGLLVGGGVVVALHLPDFHVAVWISVEP